MLGDELIPNWIQYILIHPFSAGTDFRRQNLTPVETSESDVELYKKCGQIV